jgi:hypothetical protein
MNNLILVGVTMFFCILISAVYLSTIDVKKQNSSHLIGDIYEITEWKNLR